MLSGSALPSDSIGHATELKADVAARRPLQLDCGHQLAPCIVSYQLYGTRNRDDSNAILVCHALSGDQFVTGCHPVTNRPGWWSCMVGPGLPIDTNRFFVVCSNVIGSCMGSSGPQAIDPLQGHPYGLRFPVITIADMVRAQQRLVCEHLGIKRLFCVIGGSMGGMQALEWAVSYPRAVFSAIPIATSFRHSAQNIAFHEVGRQTIMADPHWNGGDYYHQEHQPSQGLAVARMSAHITYLSEAALHVKFGRSLQDRDQITYGFSADFQVESYLHHQGNSFVSRFDANSYLYITRAMDYFDLAARWDGDLSRAFCPDGIPSPVRFCLISFTSDWLFPTQEARTIVRALNAVAADVSFVEVVTDKGHDAFLLDEPYLHQIISGFLEGCVQRQNQALSAG